MASESEPILNPLKSLIAEEREITPRSVTDQPEKLLDVTNLLNEALWPKFEPSEVSAMTERKNDWS